jgi:cyclopropane fatty-acyl-phospholipid synthase-like methyltransferase
MKPGDRILEAMSGSGRLQIPLIEKGFVVDGIDNSPTMLDRCCKRLAQKGLTALLYESSLEQAQLPHTYDVVTIAVGSFQLITDKEQALSALKNLRDHMHKGSSLLLDVFTPDTQADPRTKREVLLDDGTTLKQFIRHFFDEELKIAEAYCMYELVKHGEIIASEPEVIRVTWYSDEELRTLLHTAGFTWIKKYQETFRTSGPSYIIHAQAS